MFQTNIYNSEKIYYYWVSYCNITYSMKYLEITFNESRWNWMNKAYMYIIQMLKLLWAF